MGLHRDGSEFGLSPFEAEIRRRLWWHLMLIDIRTSEDFAGNPYPYTTNRVRVPVNLDDEDMDPNSKIDYTSKTGLTEMSPCLIRYEGCQFILSCMAVGQQGQHQCHCCDGVIPTKETLPCKTIPVEVIEKFQQDLQNKFIDFADKDLSVPKNRLVSQMARLACLKMRVLLGVFHIRKGESASHVETTKYAEEMFDNSVALLEAQSDLQNGEDFANWFWLLKNYNQWHSMAIILTQILSEINKMENPTEATLPSNLRRAWSIADLTFQQSDAVGIYDKMWGPLSSLRKKVADKLRGKPVEEESPPALSIGLGTSPPAIEDNWALPSAWTDFGSNSWIDFGSTPQINLSSTHGMVSEPWPMYFPTNLFAGGGL